MKNIDKHLSICIVSYNVCAYLNECILSIKKSISGISYEIIVVDNNSVDDTITFLKKNHPEVKIIKNHKNVGYSPAMNKAIRNSIGEYILVLSPDTIIINDAINKMLSYIKSNPDVGIVGPKTFNKEGKIVTTCHSENLWLSAFGDYLNFSNIIRNNKTLIKLVKIALPIKNGLTNDYNKTHLVDIVDGGCILIKKKLITEIGLLDEVLSIGPDDYDICKRIKIKGFQIAYLSEAEIIHYVGTSKNKVKALTIKVTNPAKFYYFKKWKGNVNSFLFLLFILFNMLIRSLFNLMQLKREISFAFFNASIKCVDIFLFFDKYKIGQKKIIQY